MEEVRSRGENRLSRRHLRDDVDAVAQRKRLKMKIRPYFEGLRQCAHIVS